MTATTDRCPGCGECPEPERPESVAPRHPGATQSPDGSQGATEGLRGPEGATGPDISEAFTEHLGALAIHHRKLEHGEHILGLGITCPCLPVIALSACERCADQLDELYAATVAREVLAAALDSPPGAATFVELATEAARRLTGIADLDAERAAHMQRWAEQAEPMLGIRGHERECADRAGRRRGLSRPFLGEGGE